VLWGTISTTRRDDPAAIRDYFVNAYKALPNLTVTFEDPYIRIYGDTAVNTGYYTVLLREGREGANAAGALQLYLGQARWRLADRRSSLVGNARASVDTIRPDRQKRVGRPEAGATPASGTDLSDRSPGQYSVPRPVDDMRLRKFCTWLLRLAAPRTADSTCHSTASAGEVAASQGVASRALSFTVVKSLMVD
jgi:hypothetical protein